MYIHASIYLPTLFIYIHISAVTIEIIHRERFLHLPPNVFKRGIYSDTARCLFRIGVDDLYVNINNTDMIYGGGNSGVLKLRAVTIVDTRLIRYEIQHTYIYVYIHICIHTYMYTYIYVYIHACLFMYSLPHGYVCTYMIVNIMPFVNWSRVFHLLEIITETTIF